MILEEGLRETSTVGGRVAVGAPVTGLLEGEGVELRVGEEEAREALPL